MRMVVLYLPSFFFAERQDFLWGAQAKFQERTEVGLKEGDVDESRQFLTSCTFVEHWHAIDLCFSDSRKASDCFLPRHDISQSHDLLTWRGLEFVSAVAVPCITVWQATMRIMWSLFVGNLLIGYPY